MVSKFFLSYLSVKVFFLSIDSILPSYIIAGNHHSKSSHRYSNSKRIDKRSNENSIEQSTKRSRISSIQIDDELQSTLNVFDILNPPDQIILDDHTSRFRSISPTDNKYRIQSLLRRYTHSQTPTIESIHPDVRSSLDALLDAVEALLQTQTITTSQPPPPPRLGRKNPRKSNSQHRIIPQNHHSHFLPCVSLDQFLSPTLPFVPLRPLSVSPPRYTFLSILYSELSCL